MLVNVPRILAARTHHGLLHVFATLCGVLAGAACSSGESQKRTVAAPEVGKQEEQTEPMESAEPQAEDAPPTTVPKRPSWDPIACDGKSVVCVDASAKGAEEGTAALAFRSISSAVDKASSDTTVLVAAGRYRESVAVSGKALRIFGGFSTGGDFQVRDPEANRTIIDAGGRGPAIEIRDADGTVVDGFKLTGGLGACNKWYCLGGGVFVDSKGPKAVTISYNEITDNAVKHEGHNSARGGGVSAAGDVVLLRNYIHRNRAERGGGVAGEGIRLVENRIEKNTGYGDHGGGVALFGPGLALIRNHISGNELGKDLGYGWGGGVLIASPGTTFVSEGNIVTDNFSASGASGFFVDDGAKGVMRNDLIVANRCGEKGAAGLFVDALDETGKTGSEVDVFHVTIADNRCKGGGGQGNAVWVQGKGSVVRMHNSILWGNGPSIHLEGSVQLSTSHTLSEEKLAGKGNISANPRFVDAKAGNYHLSSGSPGIDKAAQDAVFAKEPSPNGGRANLGAYGNTSEASQSLEN